MAPCGRRREVPRACACLLTVGALFDDRKTLALLLGAPLGPATAHGGDPADGLARAHAAHAVGVAHRQRGVPLDYKRSVRRVLFCVWIEALNTTPDLVFEIKSQRAPSSPDHTHNHESAVLADGKLP